MEKNNQKGITMVSVIIMIIIILIVASVAITQGGNVIENANIQTTNTNMLLVQAKVKIIAEKHSFDEESNPLIGIELSQMQEDEKIQNLIEEEVLTQEDLQNSYIRIWNQEIIEQQGIAQDLKGEFYIVNYQTEDIIYSKGVKDDQGETQYKLSNTIDLYTEL